MAEIAIHSQRVRVSAARAAGGVPRRQVALAIGLGVLAGAMAMAEAWPACKSLAELDRSAVADGQWWRMITGNFVHFGWRHLAADLAAFAGLYWIARRQNRAAIWVLPLAVAAVGISVQLWAGDVRTYRGLSGVGYAFLAFAATGIAIQRGGLPAVGVLTLLKIMLLKSICEMTSGSAVLVSWLPPGVAVVGVAHLAGLVTGTAAAIVFSRSLRRTLGVQYLFIREKAGTFWPQRRPTT